MSRGRPTGPSKHSPAWKPSPSPMRRTTNDPITACNYSSTHPTTTNYGVHWHDDFTITFSSTEKVSGYEQKACAPLPSSRFYPSSSQDIEPTSTTRKSKVKRTDFGSGLLVTTT